MKTREKIPHSSLRRKVSFNLPVRWKDLTQEQLRIVLTLYVTFGDQTDGLNEVKMSALANFANIGFIRPMDDGYLCVLLDSGDHFLLDAELLPGIIANLEFLEHPEKMDIRLETFGKFKAKSMYLEEITFEQYLCLENWYQTYLVTRDDAMLREMATVMYGMEKAQTERIKSDILLGIFLWYGAVKHRFAELYPHFLKPASGGGQICQESLREAIDAQLRLLTKGDVTKINGVLQTLLPYALAELDALAREAEEMKRKYGK